MQRLFRYFCAFILIFAQLASGEEFKDPNFDREVERAKALAIIENPPVSQVDVEGLESASPQAQEFLRHFKNVWAPFSAQIHSFNTKWYVSYVSVDRALYNDDAEKDEWLRNVAEYEIAKNNIIKSEEFREATKKLYELSRGLEGEVVELVEKYWEFINKFEHTLEDQELTDRLAQIEVELGDIENTSPYAETLGEVSQKSIDIKAKFQAAEISLKQAAEELYELSNSGFGAKAQDVALRSAELLNEKAVILTKLAKRRGYKTHAEFILARTAHFFGQGMQTPSERIAFLENYLDKVTPMMSSVYKSIVDQNPNAPAFSSLTGRELGLLLPDSTPEIQKYFPKERVNDFWVEFYTENGFPVEMMDALVLDSYPRKSKQTHAYMAPQSVRRAKVFTVNASDLSVLKPDAEADWYEPLISIVQNVRIDSPNGYRTVGHETGHYWEFATAERNDGPFLLIDQEGDPVRATSWTETPSMAMEFVLQDRTLLLDKLKDRQGNPIPPELLDRYLAEKKLAGLSRNKVTAEGALLDYSLWDYDFENGDESFMDRITRITTEIDKKYAVAARESKSKTDPKYSHFATNHWTSGNVKYDYFYAFQTATMVHERMLDIFDERTGRRTYLNQPDMGSILINDLYKDTHSKPYPQGVEEFSKREFNPDQLAASFQITANEIIATAQQSSAHCDELLN